MYRLPPEAKNVLCECAEYQLANSPTHDHVAAHILRQLGDRPDLPVAVGVEDDYAYDDENSEDCYQWSVLFWCLTHINIFFPNIINLFVCMSRRTPPGRLLDRFE